jgi:hypothetical protein
MYHHYITNHTIHLDITTNITSHIKTQEEFQIMEAKRTALLESMKFADDDDDIDKEQEVDESEGIEEEEPFILQNFEHASYSDDDNDEDEPANIIHRHHRQRAGARQPVPVREITEVRIANAIA